MKRRPASNVEKSSAAAPLIVLCAAVAIGLPAIFATLGFWNRLPQQHVRRITSENIRVEFARVNRSLPVQARDGLALLQASNTFADTLTNKIMPEQARPLMSSAIGAVSESQLGRLQLAALRLLTLERNAAPPDQLWPVLQVFLEGIERADFAHNQQALIRQWCTVYEATGLGPGTAYQLAEDAVGHPHGTLLQFFVPRLRQCIAQCDAAGDELAARKCRTLLGSLLKQWTLEDGSPGLQLLAADLLADFLENDSANNDSSETGAVVSELREWRRAYQQAAGARPLSTLAPFCRPAPAPDEHTELVESLALITWIGSATLTSCLTAVVFVRASLRQYKKTKRGRAFDIHGIIAAVTLLIGGLLWIQFQADTITEDLRGDFSALRYWWSLPFIAAGVTLVILLLAARLPRAKKTGQSPFSARLGITAIETWLILAATLWICIWSGESTRRDYELATRAASEQPIATLLGADAETVLPALCQWQPGQ